MSVNIISFLGYGGVFFLMVLESMVFPVPSELVMPFAGFLIANGKMSFLFVIIFSSLGSLVGSLISYYIGRYGGNKVILKFGKYMFLDETDLMKTEKWFSERGEKTVFISRFIPVVRHLISIPAGIGKMNFKKFCFYTIIGAAMWNTFLAYIGFLLGKNWELVKHYSEFISIPTAIILAIVCSYFIYRHIRNKMNKSRI
ncbi:DedA family protein [Candidatus Woesearchaeota archaeon]|nr:DedA family protein [Candidatus Woesearchaeota archaeon]